MKRFSIILIIFSLILFFSCSEEQQCVNVINKYISYSKSAKFDKIYNNLLTGPALESFSRFAKELASKKDDQQFNVVVDTFRKIKGIKVLAVEKFENDEIAVKFQIIRKDGVIEDTPWWRFKKIDGKMKIMKFSKH